MNQTKSKQPAVNIIEELLVAPVASDRFTLLVHVGTE
jgi:hypothetical protein